MAENTEPLFDSPELVEKRCTQCGETKPSSEFYVDSCNGGRRAACKECTKARQARRAELGEGSKRRQRVVDAMGRIQCRDCGEFKPPDAMKANRGKPQTICKSCKHKRDRSTPAGQARRARQRARYIDQYGSWHNVSLERAQFRAKGQLARNHPEEYSRLLAEALQEVEGEELLGWQTVSEHKRRVYGKPEILRSDNAG